MPTPMVFMQMEPDAVSDKRDWWQAELAKLFEKDFVNPFGAGTGFDRVEHAVFTLDEIFPYLDGFFRRVLDRRHAADTGVVATDDREDFDTADISRFQDAFGGSDIRQL